MMEEKLQKQLRENYLTKMETLFEDVKKACQEVYQAVRFGMDENFYHYAGRGAGGDLSSNIDLFAEKIFIKYLAKYGKIISEEAGEIGEGEFTLIIDPIDGSDNLLSRFPYFGSSIALMKDGKTLFSFIVNYASGEFFVRDGSFYKKGSLLYEKLKDVQPNYHARVGLFEKAYANPNIVQGLKFAGLKFRSPGAVALSLAYARYVKFVIFIGEIRPYDVVAGLHQCEGLYTYKNDTIIVVSKEQEIFDKIYEIVIKD